MVRDPADRSTGLVCPPPLSDNRIPMTKRRSRWILPLAALAFVGFVFYSLWHVEPVRVSATRLVRQGDQVVVRGQLRNTGPNLGGTQLEVRLFNSQGRQIAKREWSIGALPHGADRSFVSPAIVAADASTFTVAVDRGTNMYGN